MKTPEIDAEGGNGESAYALPTRAPNPFFRGVVITLVIAFIGLVMLYSLRAGEGTIK